MSPQIKTSSFKEHRDEYATAFSEAYNKLPRGLYIQVRNELISELDWSPSLLYMRLHGARPLRKSEMTVISQIFAKYGIEVFV